MFLYFFLKKKKNNNNNNFEKYIFNIWNNLLGINKIIDISFGE